jgi:RNA polymerase sigma-70 factor, ECF subfamily
VPKDAQKQPVTITAEEFRLRSGEDPTSGFEAIFLEHWSRVAGVLLRLVGEREEAEDLALETFWRYYQRPPKDEENIPGWLYRTAMNLGFNALRARNRRASYEEKAGRMALVEMSAPDPADEVERTEQRYQVREVLSRMKPRSAKLLALRHSGLSYAEVAAALQLNPISVGTLLVRAEEEFERIYSKKFGAFKEK